MSLHPAVTQGFEKTSDEYELGRPGYNRDVVDFLFQKFGVGKGDVILDLAAGTGKFTRVLISSTEAKVVALEPIKAMREKFRKLLPVHGVVGGVAERIPLRDSSVDLVTVAQAFHWFEPRTSAEEINRILKSGGGLALIWNLRDSSIPWVKEINKFVDQFELEGNVPRHKSGRWKEDFEKNAELFTQLEKAEFHSIQRGDEEMFVNRFQSISYISALPQDKRKEFEEEIRKVLRNGPLSAGKKIIELPYRVDVYYCTKK